MSWHRPGLPVSLCRGNQAWMADNPKTSRRAIRVLLVDDDADGLDLLTQLLRSQGYEVCDTSSAEDSLEALDAFQPDAAIVDIGLPDLSGYELARRIRERSACRLI